MVTARKAAAEKRDFRQQAAGNFNHSMALAAAAVFIVLLAVMAFERNFVWDTKLSLWSDAARKSPNKSRVHNNLGNCYMLLGRPFPAIEEYRRAVALNARNVEAYYNLAMNLEEVGLLGQARYYYDIFCRTAPPRYHQQKVSSCESAAAILRKLGK